jgi:hypothetical protein
LTAELAAAGRRIWCVLPDNDDTMGRMIMETGYEARGRGIARRVAGIRIPGAFEITEAVVIAPATASADPSSASGDKAAAQEAVTGSEPEKKGPDDKPNTAMEAS